MVMASRVNGGNFPLLFHTEYLSSANRKIDEVGTWLSLVEHSVRDAGVAGSNPVVPTTNSSMLFNSERGLDIAPIPFFLGGVDLG
jgi:hypothetical protein